MDEICIQVLGRVAVVRAGLASALPRAQARGVLALLALNAGRVISLDQVASAMWGGEEPATARAQVHTAISSIRRLLGDGPVTVAGGRFGYELTVDPGCVDALQFERMVRRDAADGPARAAARLREALALWRGEPLADAAGAFVDGARQQLTDRRLTALDDLAAVELASGRAAEIAAELAPAVVDHPGHERLRGRLMVALFRSGRQAEALRLFHEYRRWIAESEGLDPGAELTATAEAILRDQLPPSSGARDQPVGPASTADEPAVPTVPTRRHVVPNLLPPGLPDFVGRTAELAMITSTVRPRGVRYGASVVTIAGLGGMGKTSLAVRAAHAALDTFPDGCLYADLRGSGLRPAEPTVIVGTFLRALSVGPDDIPTEPDERLALYRSLTAQTKLLVVLDDARDEAQVRPLIPAGRQCAVLVTARAPLAGIDGAVPLRLAELSEVDGVQLLRAVARVGRDDARAIARLCGGLPLALRIAGARLAVGRDTEPAGLRRALADEQAKLDRLAVGDRDVRGTLLLSSRRLTPPAARLFALCGALPVLEAPGWVAGCLLAHDPVGALGELVDAALLTRSGPAEAPRYRMHPLVQAFAREQASGGAGAALGRAYQALAGLIIDHDAHFVAGYPTPPRDERWYGAPAAALSADPAGWFATDRELIFAAVLDAHQRGELRLSAQLLAGVTNLADMSAGPDEWGRLAELVLPDLRDRPGLADAEAALLLGHGGRLLLAGTYDRALPLLRRARRLYLTLDDPARAATSAAQIAIVYRRRMQPEPARACFEWAIARFAVAGHPPQEVQAHVGLGNLHLKAGRPGAAQECYNRALLLIRRGGDTSNSLYANVLGCLGEVLAVTGHYREAMAQYHDAMAQAANLGDQKAWAQLQFQVALVHQRNDNQVAAAHAARRAAQALDSVGLTERADRARRLAAELDTAVTPDPDRAAG